MRQKLITLCPNSWELALKKPNFSLWVRSKLLEEVEIVKDKFQKTFNEPYIPYVVEDGPKKKVEE